MLEGWLLEPLRLLMSIPKPAVAATGQIAFLDIPLARCLFGECVLSSGQLLRHFQGEENWVLEGRGLGQDGI